MNALFGLKPVSSIGIRLGLFGDVTKSTDEFTKSSNLMNSPYSLDEFLKLLSSLVG